MVRSAADDLIRGWQTGLRLSLAIRRDVDDRAVGTVELRRRPPNEVNLSHLVLLEFQRRGTRDTRSHVILESAASELSVRRAIVTCHIENEASRRVAEKAGFIHVGEFGDELRFVRNLADQ